MISTSIYQPIKPTYLYIKQHSVTKKKYFGKTTRDPYTYNGSGPYWVKHCNKHGNKHIVTLWVSDLYYDTSIVDIALQFSSDNDIVKSKEWANQKPENGLDGGSSPGRKLGPSSEEHKAKISASLKGKNTGPHSEERKANNSAAQKGKSTSEETKAKISAAKKGVPSSEETKDKISTALKGVPKPEFFSLIGNRKTYDKGNLSRYFPEFKQYY